nr:reverse transcriptase [Tanacetum cinerariifolium]
PACCDDDDDYDSAITPILSTEEPIDSLSMGDEHLDTIPATGSDEVIKSSVENLVPIPSEFEGIPDTMCDVHLDNNPTPLEAKDHVEIVINSNDNISSSDDDSLHEENIEYVEASPRDSELVSLEAAKIVIPEIEEIEDDNLRGKLLNVHLLIDKIEALKDNPTQSSDCKTKSSSTSLNSFLEETSTFHNSLPKFENFYFDLGEISSDSTTTHSDISLPDYEAFYFDDDHIKEISSGSTTTHSDISLPDYEAFYFDDDHIKEISSGSTTTHSDISFFEYDSFIFDLTHEEFVDELAHIISPPEYDRFYFWNLPDPGELMSVLNSGIRENLSTTLVNLPIEDDYSPLLAYVEVHQNYAIISQPLTKFLKKNGFHWSTEAIGAFNQWYRSCSASGRTPYCYLSKALSPIHQALSTYEKEFLAVMMALDR